MGRRKKPVDNLWRVSRLIERRQEQSLLSAHFLVSGSRPVTKAVLLRRYCQVSKFWKAMVLNLPNTMTLYSITIKLCFLLICNWFLPLLRIYNVNICFLMVIEHVCGSFTFKMVMTHRLRISALKTFHSLSVLEFFFLTGLISSFYWLFAVFSKCCLLIWFLHLCKW